MAEKILDRRARGAGEVDAADAEQPDRARRLLRRKFARPPPGRRRAASFAIFRSSSASPSLSGSTQALSSSSRICRSAGASRRWASVRRLSFALARAVGIVSVARGANGGRFHPPSRAQRQMLAWLTRVRALISA
jgi:hypothetical protein